MRKTLGKLSRAARSLAYATPAHRWLKAGSGTDGSYWNSKLSNELKSYLGGTIGVEARNALTLALVRMTAPDARSMLDVGCASGSLARMAAAEPFSYVGTDISDFAIGEAMKLSPDREFHAAPVTEYEPDRSYDVIVFNEVLYYLDVDRAASELVRYAGHLSEDGILVVGMKDDAKSAAIFKAAAKSCDWLNGLLYQEKPSGPMFSVHVSRETPAYLLGAYRLRTG